MKMPSANKIFIPIKYKRLKAFFFQLKMMDSLNVLKYWHLCIGTCDVALLHCLLADGQMDKLEWSCAELPIDGQKVVLVVSVLDNPGQFYCYSYNAEGMVLPICLCF